MGISISKSNPTPIASVILDNEFHFFNQEPSPPEERMHIPQVAPEVTPVISEPEVEIETDPIKISYSEQLNYQIKSWIYQRLYTYTEQKEILRPIASTAIAISTLSDLILRTSGVAEIALYSLGILLSSPFTRDCKENLYNAYDWISRIPYSVINTVILPIEMIVTTIFMLVVPKYFIIQKAEYAKVQKKHLEKGTLHSKSYKKDLDIASGTAYRLLLKFQRTNEKHQ